ncbi:hypothetical protein E4U41_003016 [Claviceps citrina]|nr:hypothetical protein E4U41_003016 [Claviceps citrina]
MEAAVGIQSSEHKRLLDAIDRLRTLGISRHVALPGIIVTGDQSAGKSSVLEAISGLSFPAKDNLCTRFATELSLRRSPCAGIRVSIIPGRNCGSAQKEKLAKFDPKLEEGMMDIGTVIGLAQDAMGIAPRVKTFSDDMLRIEVSGPEQPHLTMVDLPGLFQAGNSAQSDEDSETVASMVIRYMKEPRSIILAVVSAKSDFTLQKVTRLARDFDPQGGRTLGLITKPDTLDDGSEGQMAYVRLAQNDDVPLSLGWHVLRNRDYKMVTAEATSRERDEAEAAFFSQGIWSTLEPATVGAAALKARLSTLLKNQIIAQLPSLVQDVEEGIAKCRDKLKKLGRARATLADQKNYLIGISQKFSALLKDAIDGHYQDVSFFGSSGSEQGFERRLRAVIQSRLASFADDMHEAGCSKQLVDGGDDDEEAGASLGENQVLRSTFVKETALRIGRNRGRELPGTFNPSIVGELFSEQCQPWGAISEALANELVEAVQKVSHAMMYHIAVEETAEKLDGLVSASIHDIGEGLRASFAALLRPHQELHPITYNSALTDNVHRAQTERRRRRAEARIASLYKPEMGQGDWLRVRRSALVDLLSSEEEADARSCGSALAVDYMEAYYDVSLRKYIDNISTLGVERDLIQRLRHVLEPSHIQNMHDDQLRHLAAENPAAAQERAKQTDKMASLQEARRELRGLSRFRSPGQQGKCLPPPSF